MLLIIKGIKSVDKCENRSGDQFNRLNNPTFILFDENHSLYVSDTDNHRIVK